MTRPWDGLGHSWRCLGRRATSISSATVVAMLVALPAAAVGPSPSPSQPQRPVVQTPTEASGINPWLAMGGMLLCLAVGFGLGWWIARATRPTEVLPSVSSRVSNAPQAPPPQVVPGNPQGQQSSQEQEHLIKGLVGAHDLAENSPAVQAHIEQVLRRSGVVRIDCPVGTPFDATTQTVVDTEPARHPDEVHRVARQLRPGWSRNRIPLRLAEVVVWK
jgi:hypothetical protein